MGKSLYVECRERLLWRNYTLTECETPYASEGGARNESYLEDAARSGSDSSPR